MKRLTVPRVMFCLVFAIIFLLTGVSAQAQSQNLLRNPGFEPPFTVYTGEAPRQVAQDWTPWNLSGGSTESELNQPDYCAATAIEDPCGLGIPRVRGGQDAQQYHTFYATHDAGVYQRVTAGITSGAQLRFSVFVYVWSSAFDDVDQSEQDGGVAVRVGIDPTGGTDATSSNVVWSQPTVQYDTYAEYTVTTAARGNAATVFVRTTVSSPARNNNVYVDDASLTVEGAQIPPTATSTETIAAPATNTPIIAPTFTPVPPATNTPIIAPTFTPVPAATNTPIVAPTFTPAPPATNTPIVAPTFTPAPPATNTPIVAPTFTPVPPATNTPIVAPTFTPVPAATETPAATIEAPATSTPIVAPTFTPVPPATETPAPTSTPTEVQPPASPTQQEAETSPTPVTPGAPISDDFPNSITHTVQNGDTVGRLATLYGSTIDAIVEANGLNQFAFIRVGQQLVIPVRLAAPATSTPTNTPEAVLVVTATPGTTAPVAEDNVYIVQPGDTLSAIAARYNTTVAALAQLNGIVNPNIIRVGQRLVIPVPGGTTPPAGGNPPSTPPTGTVTYVVQPGDNLFRIALRFGVPMSNLIQANGIVNPSRIFVGQQLVIR